MLIRSRFYCPKNRWGFMGEPVAGMERKPCAVSGAVSAETEAIAVAATYAVANTLGSASAALIPWSMQVIISTPGDEANPPISDAAVKTISSSSRARIWPIMSPSLPLIGAIRRRHWQRRFVPTTALLCKIPDPAGLSAALRSRPSSPFAASVPQ